MRVFIFIGAFFLFNSSNFISDKKENNNVINYKNIGQDVVQKDTVWVLKKLDFFVYYLKEYNQKTKVYSKNGSFLFWGNGTILRHSPDTLVDYVLERCRFDTLVDNVIIIKSASGNGLATTLNILLPLNFLQKYTEIYCPLEFYIKKNIVIYSGCEFSDEFIIVKNIKNGKQFVINEKKLCFDSYASINNVKIIENVIYYEWYSGVDCNSKLMKKKIILPDYIF